MSRGRLRVFLGAAPGVGKTYAMLEEAARLRDEGIDVVVAVVETHDRAATAALTTGFETIPRRAVSYRDVALTEMDVDAVLERDPALAVVDELAHTNAPGSRNAKRWQDVEELLAAGIDVLSTINVQHIESLNDVVHRITGVPQRETVPDDFLRGASQIEVVDIAPQALRDRLAGGLVYATDRVDAALSNYFRLGNLTALRELTLLWLADEVDKALAEYRSQHGIDSTWEARERVVVALTGGPEGETLLRRGARIAARTAGGELVAVHIAGDDGLVESNREALERQRTLTETLGGTYHQVIGSDVPRALIDFARSVNATQLVIGVSRRGRIAAALSGPGIGSTVIRESGDIDVHIVTHSAAGGKAILPRLGRGALSPTRRWIGGAFALVALPALTVLLRAFEHSGSITAHVLAYQLVVIVTAVIGGIFPAVIAALAAALLLNYFFTDPLYSVTIANTTDVLALVFFVVNAAIVSVVVDQAARRLRTSRRAVAESELLAIISGSVVRGADAVAAIMTSTQEAFGLEGARLVHAGQTTATAGVCTGVPSGAVPVGEEDRLELFGRLLTSSERRVVSAIASQLDAALKNRDLADAASAVGPLAQIDRVRSALLNAVSHDLRRPLAAATASVSALRSQGITWSDGDRDELLATADESLATLTQLVTNLLDVGRLEAGALAAAAVPVDVDSVILASLDELHAGPQAVQLELAKRLPPVRGDAGLLQRVMVNLLANALRFSPADARVRLETALFDGWVEIRIADRGPGVSADRRDDIFVPFQRLGDRDNETGLGLGLAVARGFMEGMGGTLVADDTPGGGLTMIASLPAVTVDSP